MGVIAALSDRWGSGYPPQQAWRAVGLIANAGAVWAAVAVLAGLLVGRRLTALLVGPVALVAAVGGYYLAGLTVGDRADVGLSGLSGVVRLWLVVAVLVGSLLGLAGHLARRGDGLGTLARLVVPVAVLVEVAIRFRPSIGEFSIDPVRAWTLVVMVILALLGAAGSVLALRPRRTPAT